MSPSVIVVAVLAMGVLAMADFCIKQSSGRISSSLGTLIYAVTTIAIPLVWTLWTRSQGELQVTQEGVLWSIGTGISFSLFTGMIFYIFSSGVNLSIGTPVIRMGGIVIAATLGIVVFREGINWQYVLGFLLATAGIFLVVTR